MEPGSLVAGKYRVERVLGEGGMGRVLEATHLELDQKVAIKHLLPEAMSRPEAVPRFLREARAAVKLRSEHAARVLDVGTSEDGIPYMVMEFLDGKDLSQVLRDHGALPPMTAVGYLLQVCEAVAEAHGLGIVHRDLKPGNLFLAQTAHGTDLMKVLDFGLSKTRPTEDDFSLTKTSALMGSPGYMSPEQLRAPRDVGARSDIWSLGVVLYELVEGVVPFNGETFSELCIKVAMEQPPPLTRVAAGLALVVNRCLEKDPERRFADVAQLAAALVPWGPPGSLDSAARTARLLQGKLRASTVPAPPPPPPYASTLDSASGAMPTQNPPRSHWGAVLAATVTAGAGLILWLTFGRVAGPLATPDAAPRAPAPAVAPAPVIVPDAAPPPTPPDASPPPGDAPMPPRKKPIKRPAATEPDVYDNRN